MDTLISFLVLSTLTQLVVPQGVSLTTLQAAVELVSRDARIFSGEGFRLRCKIPNGHISTWTFRWFRGSEQLAQSGEDFVMWKARVGDSGKFYCQGVRDSAVGNIYTAKSQPVEINVDGGWAILQVPHHPGLVGETLGVKCRVRWKPKLHEVVLYKDGVEVVRQQGANPEVTLTHLSLEDQGMYSCRASWDIERRTRSAISAETPLQVLDILSQPTLEIDTDIDFHVKMKLICHVQYNAPAPAPPINYYFYKDNNRLGVATSENHDLVLRIPGQYSCKAKVPLLNLSRMSEPKSFGLEKGGKQLHSAKAEPTPTQHAPSPSKAAPSFIQSKEVSTQHSHPFLDPSQPQPSPSVSTVLFHNPIANPESMKVHQESDYMSGDFASGDTSGKAPLSDIGSVS